MSKEKCDQCDEPSESFIGSERKPLARFCHEHGRKLTKASAAQRGRILGAIMRRRTKEEDTMAKVTLKATELDVYVGSDRVGYVTCFGDFWRGFLYGRRKRRQLPDYSNRADAVRGVAQASQ